MFLVILFIYLLSLSHHLFSDRQVHTTTTNLYIHPHTQPSSATVKMTAKGLTSVPLDQFVVFGLFSLYRFQLPVIIFWTRTLAVRRLLYNVYIPLLSLLSCIELHLALFIDTLFTLSLTTEFASSNSQPMWSITVMQMKHKQHTHTLPCAFPSIHVRQRHNCPLLWIISF